MESDPSGLWGGLNTYAYVLDGPTQWGDPNGLMFGKVPDSWKKAAQVLCAVLNLSACHPEHPEVNPNKAPKIPDKSQWNSKPVDKEHCFWKSFERRLKAAQHKKLTPAQQEEEWQAFRKALEEDKFGDFGE